MSSRTAPLFLLLLLLAASALCRDAHAVVIRKCCPPGRALRHPHYDCVPRTGAPKPLDWLDPAARIESLDGRRLKQLFPAAPPPGATENGDGFRCGMAMVLNTSRPGLLLLENGVIKDNGSLVPHSNIWFPPESYCTDRVVQEDASESYAYMICEFKKCCGENQTVTNSPLNCSYVNQAETRPWRPKVYDENFHELNISQIFLTKMLIRPQGNMGCDLNTSYYKFMVETKNTFYLRPNSSVYIGDPLSKVFNYADFCVDRTFVAGEIHTALAICVPKAEKLNFWNVICVTVNCSLCFCIFVFPFVVPKLYTTTMQLVMCHVACDIFIYVTRTIAFALGDLPMAICKIYALAMQYFRLAGFFWINVMCIDMTSTFSGKMRARERGRRRSCTHKFTRYALHACGWPAVIVAATAVLDLAPGLPDHPLRPYFGDLSCTFHSLKAAFVYYVGPVTLLLVINFGLFIITSISIYRTKQEVLDIFAMDQFESNFHHGNRQDQRSVMMYLKIFFLMGLTYVAEIIAWIDGSPYTSSVMDVNSMIQSLLIFLLFCYKPQVLRERLEELKVRLHFRCPAPARKVKPTAPVAPVAPVAQLQHHPR